MTTHRSNKPFAMIREFHLADWFTLGNAVCGVGALFSTMSYLETSDVVHIYFACALVLAALIFDVLDGRIARWRQKSSAWAASSIRWPTSSRSAWRRPSLPMAAACRGL
jgi:CDP-diacylglycerol--serine O-phosphatidyltransferase